MRRLVVAFVLTVAAVSAVALARRGPGPYAGGVPSYRIRGAARAPVVIVMFSDFQCPNCAKAEPILKALLARHEKDVRVYFRHRPLRMHKWARLAARAAEAAGLQGHFWEYHDVLYDRQKDWSLSEQDPSALLLSYARELHLDEERFRRDWEDPRWEGLVAADEAAGAAASVNATPTFFIGEDRVVGAAALEAEGERLVEEKLR